MVEVEKGSMMIAVRCDMGESVLTLFYKGGMGELDYNSNTGCF